MATTLSFGKCAACGENNNRATQMCRKCAALLPWSEAAKAKSSGKASAPPGGKPKMQVVGPKTPVVSSDAMARWGFGLALMFFCMCISPIGSYFLHKRLEDDEHELAGFALAGMVTSVILWALTFVAIMATAGQKPAP